MYWPTEAAVKTPVDAVRVTLPVTADGVNAEDDYYWARYFFGSSQIRPRTSGAVIKQPITFA